MTPKEAKSQYDKERRERLSEELKVKSKREFEKMPLEKRLYRAAKQRAKSKGLPFSITMDDIIVPKTCPVLGIPLIQGKLKFTKNSPTLDKLIPELGYVKGNINVISRLANVIKQDVDSSVIQKVATWVKEKEDEQVPFRTKQR